MKHRLVISGIVGTLFVALAGTAAAEGHGRRGGPARQSHLAIETEFLSELSQLNLSPRQSKRVSQLRKATVKRVNRLQDRARGERQQLRSLQQAQRPNVRAIERTQRQLQRIQRQLVTARTNFRSRVVRLLTPPQRRQLRQVSATASLVHQPRRPVRYRSASTSRGYAHPRPVRQVSETPSSARSPQSSFRPAVAHGRRGCCGDCRQGRQGNDRRRDQSQVL